MTFMILKLCSTIPPQLGSLQQDRRRCGVWRVTNPKGQQESLSVAVRDPESSVEAAWRVGSQKCERRVGCKLLRRDSGQIGGKCDRQIAMVFF